MQQLRQQLNDVLQQLSQVLADNNRLRAELAAAHALAAQPSSQSASSPSDSSPSASGPRSPAARSTAPATHSSPMDADDDLDRRRPRDPAPTDSPLKDKPPKGPRRSKSAEAGQHGH